VGGVDYESVVVSTEMIFDCVRLLSGNTTFLADQLQLPKLSHYYGWHPQLRSPRSPSTNPTSPMPSSEAENIWYFNTHKSNNQDSGLALGLGRLF
jgi:hypothetical protein